MTVTLTLSESVVVAKRDGRAISSPHQVLPILAPLRDRSQEHLVAITVDARGRAIGVHTVSIGSADAAFCHPRDVFRPAILDNASGVVLAHNHPSGDCEPSLHDRAATRQLTQAGDAIGIALLDHIIVGGENAFYAFREQEPDLFAT
ncbi:MAG TPA: JAB domain-containing protein [Chthonomonadaceae bacterium]|nr:JAB domain-containing protein [Chthonomonadaceae bacterium]